MVFLALDKAEGFKEHEFKVGSLAQIAGRVPGRA
jgi:hypothetical protein